MRHNFIALAGLAATLAITAPAFALNPQPLPPGIHKPDEPPDPCFKYRKHPRAHARCEAQLGKGGPRPDLTGGDGGVGETHQPTEHGRY